jgi:hypothetical protein
VSLLSFLPRLRTEQLYLQGRVPSLGQEEVWRGRLGSWSFKLAFDAGLSGFVTRERSGSREHGPGKIMRVFQELLLPQIARLEPLT